MHALVLRGRRASALSALAQADKPVLRAKPLRNSRPSVALLAAWVVPIHRSPLLRPSPALVAGKGRLPQPQAVGRRGRPYPAARRARALRAPKLPIQRPHQPGLQRQKQPVSGRLAVPAPLKGNPPQVSAGRLRSDVDPRLAARKLAHPR